MHVTVKISDDRTVNFPVVESDQPDAKYKLPGRGNGLHFKSQKSVENHFKRKFKKSQSVEFKS